MHTVIKVNMIDPAHLLYFNLIKTTPSKAQKKALLKTITTDQLKALCEIVLNVLNKNLPLKSNHKEKFLRYKYLWVQLAEKSISLSKKKILLKLSPILTLLDVINLK